LELCSGPDLYTYLKTNKTLPEKDARIIISQILSGIEYLNRLQKKIIHYDLKPQNIIFNNMEVKISDFGLAKIMEDNTDKLTSQGVGTYWYLPPECFDTDKNPPGISSKVDVWSIGVILYELVFGIRPFGHSLTQDRILKENIITNAKKVEFPSKPIVSEECKVRNFKIFLVFFFIFLYF
jgi:tousled-like kinase